MIYTTKESILKKSKEAIGKKFSEIDRYDRLSTKTKGMYGHVMEESLYGYSINSDKNPDFITAGVELKVTPFKINKNGSKSAKERLVLNIIDYMNENLEDFYESQFWHKNKSLMLFFYLHDFEKIYKDFEVVETLLYEYPEDDLMIIKSDWEKIASKIRNGEAHLLSESDTMYLAACTKGATAESSKRKQPFASINAKQRAYSLKQSYMTSVLRNYVFGTSSNEKIVKDHGLLDTFSDFEDYIISHIKQYIGQSREELMNLLNIEGNPKHLNNVILRKIFGTSKNLNNTDEFIKANIIAKSITVENDGRVIESMSFPAFKFEDIYYNHWNESSIREMFHDSKFLFTIFKKYQEDVILDNAFFWSIPDVIIENQIKKIYNQTRKLVLSGEIVKYQIGSKRYTNFPSKKDNYYCHIRPHAKNRNDTYPLPVSDKLTGLNEYTKHCFWLNNDYIANIVKLRKLT